MQLGTLLRLLLETQLHAGQGALELVSCQIARRGSSLLFWRRPTDVIGPTDMRDSNRRSPCARRGGCQDNKTSTFKLQGVNPASVRLAFVSYASWCVFDGGGLGDEFRTGNDDEFWIGDVWNRSHSAKPLASVLQSLSFWDSSVIKSCLTGLFWIDFSDFPIRAAGWSRPIAWGWFHSPAQWRSRSLINLMIGEDSRASWASRKMMEDQRQETRTNPHGDLWSTVHLGDGVLMPFPLASHGPGSVSSRQVSRDPVRGDRFQNRCFLWVPCCLPCLHCPWVIWDLLLLKINLYKTYFTVHAAGRKATYVVRVS